MAQHKKLAAISFNKNFKHPLMMNLEEVFIYGILTRLTLHTDIACKDYATQSDRLTLDEATTDGETLEQLKQIGRQTGSRFVLTGVIQSNAKTPEDDFTELKITVRLYDTDQNRFCLEETKGFSAFDTATKGQVNVSMDALNKLINWAAAAIAKAICPDMAAALAEQINARPLSSSYQALNSMVQAQKRADQDEKKRFYEQAAKADPDFELAWYNLAKSHRGEQAYEKSVQHYRKALEVSQAGNELKAIYATDAGICCAILKRTDLALQWWQRAIELKPDYINPYFNIANTYEDMNDFDQAVGYFEKAQQLAPDDFRTIYNLARIYSKVGNWQKALEQYQQQLAMDENDPWGHNDAATCYLNLGQPDLARQHLEKTVALDPEGEAGDYAKLILGGLVPA